MTTNSKQESPSGLPTIAPANPARLRNARSAKARGRMAVQLRHLGSPWLAELRPPKRKEETLIERTPEMAMALAIFSALAPDAQDQVCRVMRVLGMTSPAVKELAVRLPWGGA